MKTISRILGALIAGALICGAGLGAYFGFKFAIGTFSSMKFYVDPITAMAWGVTLVAALIIANSIRRAGQQQAGAHLLKGKSEAYQVFVSLWIALLHNGLSAERHNHSKTEEELKALDGLLALCASPGVLRVHTVLRELERKHGGQDQRVRLQFAQALLEIRRDLGLEQRGLSPKELMQLLSSDSGGTQLASPAGSQLDSHPRVSLAPN
jgi:hypothetical protein